MSQCALIYNRAEEFSSQAEILSRSACCYLTSLARSFGCTPIYLAGQGCPDCGEDVRLVETDFSGPPSLFAQLEPVDRVLVFFESLPALTKNTLGKLLEQNCGLLADQQHRPLALFAPREVTLRLSGNPATLVEELKGLGPMLTEISLTAQDGCVVTNGLELYQCQQLLRRRINLAHMEAGVTIMDPDSTYISPDALVEPGARIMPGCFIYGQSHIEATAVIGPNSMIIDSVIGCGAVVNNSQVVESVVGAQTTVGPFAYLRPGCDIGEKARLGTFVELKKAKLANGVKVAHLSYLGDIQIGEASNIGGGVIICNYDGKKKYQSTVGAGSFVGSNVNLVSPVHLGENSYIATGSTITEDVPDQALALARARQVNKEGWVARRREKGLL